ncbi:MAG TPA: PEP/pyruvate-binding domain-containing protein [Draconibacterium sp.]|nr:PEP/pyruvate-binding domain-containing protein [Draconibacterium sp.]
MTKVRFNFIRVVVVIILSLVVSLDLIAQYSYIGRVSDLLTGIPVGKVMIYNKHFQTTSITEKDGVFILDYNNSRKENRYQILFNVFFAPADENVSLQLFSVDGKRILQTGYLGKGGKYLFPALKQGVYILAVESENQSDAIKIFSNGNELSYYQNQQVKTKYDQTGRDTLVFSKDGYYGVEIAVPRADTTIHIKLLKETENDLNYLNGLPEYKAFNLLQSSPFVTNHGEVESVKFIYNRNNGKIYFMNSKRYEFHYDFAVKFLSYNKGLYHFNMVQYSASKERFLFPGSLNYYKATGIYVLRFYPGDEMGCAQINEILETLYATTYLKNKVYLFPNNSNWENCSGIPVITADELYEGQNYQALNLTKGFGYLRKVEIGEMGKTYLGKHDIIVLNGIPNDVSVVSGIITTEFQTPLSHLNILSHNRGTPNMALRDGWTNPKLDSLVGELVYLEVLSDSFIIRKATQIEAQNYWDLTEPKNPVVLEKDENTQGLVDLTKVNYSSVKLIGGKAANFAELLKIKNPSIPTPENAFAIPFYYYSRHIKNNGIEAFITQILADENFKTNQEYRQEKLNELQEKILDAPISQDLVEMVRSKIDDFKTFEAFRFRSSTNAEDLEFFSGAGLYDSFSAKKNDETKTIETAIKKVWASLWNIRAFDEREYYKIDQLSAAMGILVHRSFPAEEANGVVITKNLYNVNPGFIVNVQFKENSIVFPDPGIIHDQIILFAYSLNERNNFTIEYLSHSNIAELNGKNVLTDEELYALGDYCMQIKKHFFYNIPNSCKCLFDDFALDIEFKIDEVGGRRNLYIKQARIYN